MKLTGSLLAMIYLLLCARTAFAADQFLCVPDKTTGFAYNRVTKEWDTATLKTNQFLIAPAKNERAAKNERVAYTVTEIGEKDNLPGYCEKDFNDAGILFCDTFGGEIKFNKVNRRFLRIFYFAYYTVGIPGPVKETDEDSGTPMLEIGKCTPF
jgi:hypothetical protein